MPNEKEHKFNKVRHCEEVKQIVTKFSNIEIIGNLTDTYFNSDRAEARYMQGEN